MNFPPLISPYESRAHWRRTAEIGVALKRIGHVKGLILCAGIDDVAIFGGTLASPREPRKLITVAIPVEADDEAIEAIVREALATITPTDPR